MSREKFPLLMHLSYDQQEDVIKIVEYILQREGLIKPTLEGVAKNIKDMLKEKGYME